MPTLTGQITELDDLVEFFRKDLEANAEPLGLGYVGTYDERLIPAYPAVVVSPGIREKEPHATHTFLYTLTAFFYIMHAQLTLDHKMRNREDMQLASRVEDFIERDKTLGDRLIFGYIESQIPGVLSPRSDKGSAVVSTRLQYRATSEGRF